MANKPTAARYLPALACLLLTALGTIGWLLYQLTSTQPAEQQNVSMSVLVSGYAASTQAHSAVAGTSGAYDELATTAAELNAILTASLTAAQKEQLGQIRAAVSGVLNGKADVNALRAAETELVELTKKFSSKIYALQGQLAIQRQPAALAHLERLRLLGDSLPVLGGQLYAGQASVDQAMLANELELQQIVKALQAGDPALGITAVAEGDVSDSIAALARRADQISASVRAALQMSTRLPPVRESRDMLAKRVAEFEPGVAATPASPLQQVEVQRIFALLGATLFIVLLMLLLWFSAARKNSKTAQMAERSEDDQQAILQLLDELGNLADGDLTVQATVSEDITGAIADSINYAIEALRELVATINKGVILVEETTKQTQISATSLEAASEAQARQVKDAMEAVHNMASSIDEISGNAERSADVARHSVDIAHKGGDAVRRTIAGMNTIRETIQDTSKRIKRLGESSQEIGDIVELINDIADQTNVLALNASIQASMAGEAGRGFAVVADEVQRLAERSANATKQIEVLVSTIQSDTNEAVVSMERSTTDVVGGALLAENAGAALEEIEQVSNQIAMLVQNIYGSAREQTQAAKTVLQIVARLNEISAEADASASTTARFIGKLSPLATQLRESVAGFVLPGESPAAQAAVAPQNDAATEAAAAHRKPVANENMA